MKIKVGSTVIYEGKRCEVIIKTENKVVLKNLDISNSTDWRILEIKLEELNEEEL